MRETRSRYNSACILVALLLLVPLFSVNVAAASVPDPPTNVTADGGNAKITLNWTAPVNNGGAAIDGYLVYKGSSPLAMTFYRNVLPTIPLTFQDTTVINGQTYYYNITAHNSMGQSTYSSTVSAMPLNVPSAPTAATATPAIGHMTLNWNPPYNEGGSPVTNYRIYRGTSASLLLFLKDSAQTFSTDSGLSNGQTYYYQISAVNAVGEGLKCAVFSGTLASPPGPLLDLQAVASDSKVTLTWTAPSDNGGSSITGYVVYRSILAGHETVLQPVTATTYQDLNLVNGVTYYYRVSAVNAVGEGQLSAEVASTPAAVLGPPTSITATPSDSAISLSWTAPADTGGSSVSSYKIYRGTSATTLLFLVSVTQTSYQDTGLTNGQAYFYKISSVNTVGEGLQSGAVSATPFSTPTVPLSLSAMGGNSGVSLGWAAPFSNGGASISRYHIYWSESATGPWTMIDTLSAGLVYAHTGLTNGHTYYYQVAAVNAAGEGPRTATASATPRTVPSAPAISSATGGVGNVTLIWTSPASDGGASLIKYSVYRGASSGSETFLRDVGLTLGVVDSSVSAGVTYYYRITAWNSQGESLRSNEASATTFGLPTAPTSLTGSAADSSISLQWGAPSSDGGSAISAYRVFFGFGSGNYFGNQTVSSNSFLQSSLTNGVRYYYAVSAINAVGEGPLSSEWSNVPMTNPSAPQSLLALGGVRQISLSWMPPLVNGGSNVTGYKLYRGPTATSQSLIAVLGPELLFMDTGLSNGTTYHYSVTAINSRGESLHSFDAWARTNSVPTVPIGFSVIAGDSRASLDWSAPTDSGGSAVSSYNVYRSTTLGGYVLIGNTASLTYSDPGLSNGQRYYYSVAAVNAVGEGTRTNQIPIVPATSPAEPTHLVADPGVKGISLSWTAPSTNGGSPILGYHILRGSAPGSESQYVDAGTISFTDAPLNDGETHYYKVVAYNAVNDGPVSNEASATSFSLPSAPSFLHATVSDRSVSLLWSEPVTNGGTPLLYYTIYRGDSSGALSALTSISSLSYDDPGLTNGHLYYYAVSATNAVGEGPSTTPITAMPSRTPSVPMHLTSVGGIRQVVLSWSQPSDNGGAGISSYRLYRSETENGSYELVLSLGSTSYTDTQLENGVQYFYRVTALNSAGEGPYAGTNSTTFPLPEPTVLKADASGLDVHLSWAASSSATAYRLYRGDASGEETYLRSVLTTSYVDGPFASGRTLYYFVTAVNVTGESTPSNEANTTIVTLPSA
ncbi:MAG: fibronectin type III domain-containing protein, partial [Methanomassiliicoccales archaeon]